VAIYSTFLQRAYDQLIHDVAIQDLDVLFAVDRAGIVGPDGATHTGNFDISFCRCIPGMVIMTPAHTEDLHTLLNTGYDYPGPALVRYPRDQCRITSTINTTQAIEIGKSETLRQGRNIALLVFGPFLEQAQPLAEQFDCTLVNMRFVKPLDENLLSELTQTHRKFVCIEDNSRVGGAGSAVSEWLHQMNSTVHCHLWGLQDEFPQQGTRNEILLENKLDSLHLQEFLRKLAD
jgi:1-deoxy-D-xylulose-5-phosphate synthase